MKILIVADVPWYDDVVRELRQNHEVDYVFKSPSKSKINEGDYPIPKLFGYHRGYLVLAYIFVAYLLLAKRHDVCLTDYKSVYLPTFLPVLRRHTRFIRTNFVYDVRTVPVEYPASQAESIERRFYRQVRFVNRFYQGITVITPEMKKYIQGKCPELKNDVGIWESGVDTEIFRILPKNMGIKRKLGFDDNDFVCFYHGSLSDKRGVVELAESFRIIKRHEQAIKLVILGRGECSGRLEKIVRDADMEDVVKIHDWVGCAEVPQFISMADLCVIPLPDIDWWRVSSPLKLMEYIACGKNILMSDIVAHTSVVGRNDDYFWMHETTAESFAENIIDCYRQYIKDQQNFVRKGIAGRNRVVGQITWACRSRSLQEYLEKVLKAA